MTRAAIVAPVRTAAGRFGGTGLTAGADAAGGLASRGSLDTLVRTAQSLVRGGLSAGPLE